MRNTLAVGLMAIAAMLSGCGDTATPEAEVVTADVVSESPSTAATATTLPAAESPQETQLATTTLRSEAAAGLDPEVSARGLMSLPEPAQGQAILLEGRVWALASTKGTVMVTDLTTEETTATVAFSFVHGIATIDGRVFVIGQDGGDRIGEFDNPNRSSIKELDAATGEVIGSFALPTDAVANGHLSAYGDLLVVQSERLSYRRLYLYDLTGQLVNEYRELPNPPVTGTEIDVIGDVAYLNGGQYINDEWVYGMWTFDFVTERLLGPGGVVGGSLSHDFFVADDGTIWSSDSDGGRVWALDGTTLDLQSSISAGDAGIGEMLMTPMGPIVQNGFDWYLLDAEEERISAVVEGPLQTENSWLADDRVIIVSYDTIVTIPLTEWTS